MRKTRPEPVRNGDIVARRAAGETLTSIARRYGLSVSRTSQIVSRAQQQAAKEARRCPRCGGTGYLGA